MRTPALLIFLAIGAALLGAPSPASAAGSALTDAAASPTVVAPGALVRLSVAYDGKFPATSVTAQVGGLNVNLVRQSGTATAGTWAAAVTLPAGTWTVVYTATTTQGKVATLSGPTISVGSILPGTVAPSTPDGSGGPGPSTRLPIESSSATPDEPAPPAAPAPSAASTPGSVTADEPVSAAPGGSTVSGTTAPPRGSEEAPAAAPSVPTAPAASVPADPRGDDGPDGSIAVAPIAPSPNASAGMAEPMTPDGGSPVRIGLVGAAAIAVVGIGLVAALRERRRREEPIVVPDHVAEVLDRRTLRQGRVRLEADPIIAALGIGDPEERRPRGQQPVTPHESDPGDDA
ncbi:MAG TPA: hypothetical protein VFW95_09450 [Candidatus Limnocylindria bacterium]|nr:hypothetical protein [Candidatus Limnocylindria bacterium]